MPISWYKLHVLYISKYWYTCIYLEHFCLYLSTQRSWMFISKWVYTPCSIIIVIIITHPQLQSWRLCGGKTIYNMLLNEHDVRKSASLKLWTGDLWIQTRTIDPNLMIVPGAPWPNDAVIFADERFRCYKSPTNLSHLALENGKFACCSIVIWLLHLWYCTTLHLHTLWCLF